MPSHLRREVVKELRDIQLDYWVSSGQEDMALSQIKGASEGRRLQLCEMIALGTCDLQPNYFQQRHQRIIQRCQQQGTDCSGVRAALAKYFHPPAASQNNAVSSPNHLAAESQAIVPGRKKANFVRINASGQRIALVMEGEESSSLMIFRVCGRIIKREGALSGESMGWVTQLKWNHPQLNSCELIGLCSYEKLMIVQAG